MANSVNDDIRSRVEAFTEELAELIRQQAMETVREALTGSIAAPARRGPGRPRGSKSQRGPGRPPAAAAGRRGPGRPRGSGRGKGAKRNPEELEQLTLDLHDYVKKNPGQRIEEIARGMDRSTKELNLPAKKLISNKQLRTKGQKRATQYFAK